MIKEYTRYPLLAHNTFGIEAYAEKFIEYSSEEDLILLLSRADFNPLECLHIGGGSNLLFLSDYPGTILHSAIKGIRLCKETPDYVHIAVGAGETWDDVVAYCVEQGWTGAENLSLIPGEAGATAVQNIGAYGVEVKDLIVSVRCVDLSSGDHKLFSNEDCCFSYRQSNFKKEWKRKYAVTEVSYRLSKHPSFHLEYGNIKAELEKYEDVNLKNIRKAVISIRESKLPDPKVEGNAGSFFMNPVVGRDKFEALQKEYSGMPYYEVDAEKVKIPAGWMIDRCGWKGKCLGKAGVHDKQALVLVNKGGATGEDILRLSDAVRASVKEKFGIDIYPEVNFI